jgi:hypothetical protein
MPSDYGKFDVEFEFEWDISIRELIPDNPIDIIKGLDSKLARGIDGMSEVKADYSSVPDDALTIKIKALAENLDVKLPDDTEGMPEEDIEAELMMNAEDELGRMLSLNPRDITVTRIRHD